MTEQLNEIEAMQAKTENLTLKEALIAYASGEVIEDAYGYRRKLERDECWCQAPNKEWARAIFTGSFFADKSPLRIVKPAPKVWTADEAMRAGKQIKITAPYPVYERTDRPNYGLGFTAVALEADRQIAAGVPGWAVEVLD